MTDAARAEVLRSEHFDHAVLNLHHDLDAAEDAFRSLGFTLTDRGYHSLGSINHLIVFDDHYFELVGLDAANPNPRRELLDWPVGINGVVFQTDDAVAQAESLSARGIPAAPAKSFSRPVFVDGQERQARFRTTTVERGYFPAARLYFCEHQTPELIWRPEYLRHANTACGLRRIHVAAENPEELASRLANAAGLERDRPVTVASGDLVVSFGETPGPARVTEVGFAVRSIEACKASLDPRWLPHLVQTSGHTLHLTPAGMFGVTFEFSERW